MKKSGAMTSKVFGDGGVAITPAGFRIDIRLPWYRSLPVSTVEIDSVSIDEVPVDRGNVTFELGDLKIALLPLFRDNGYSGFMSSEWEGHMYSDADAFNMIERHQAMCRRILAAA